MTAEKNGTMGSEFFFRDKIPVAILGATGCVGQTLIQALEHHPWFQMIALCASETSAGKLYKDAVHWMMPTPLPQSVADMTILPCRPPLECSLVFSALDPSVAGEIETQFAQAGHLVVSNSRNHRMDPNVPLLIGEVNPDHLEIAKTQIFENGKIITNPNCSAIGLCIALKPLIDYFGIESVHVVTMQAVSGAGYPGVASLDILDNLVPYIQGEEAKIEQEPLKILGKKLNGTIEPATLTISAQCNRIAVTDGHTACISVKLRQQGVTAHDMIEAWHQFSGEPQELNLPTAPFRPIHYFEKETLPQPKLQRSLDKGMAVSIGRLRKCPLFDYKFTIVSNNMIRGAAGAAILNAELLVKKGWIYW
jgi:aspartate-semialdehyde dehydrogenase